MIAFRPRLGLHVLREIFTRLGESLVLVDYSQLFNDIVMEPIEHDQYHATPRRESKQSLFGEAISFQSPVLKQPYGALVFLGVPVQNRQIQVARCLRIAEVTVVGLKEIVDNQRCLRA